MKHVLVTGGTRGIGLAAVKEFVKGGACVTALYSRDGAAAELVKKQLPTVNLVCADVSKEEDVKRVFEKLPALDVLVNNAGISHYAQVQDTTLTDWNKVMSVNAGGAFLCTKYAVKKFLARGAGSIVNVSSVWGECGGSCESAYSASKGALIAFTKALAKELAPSQITVNCVTPGVIDTDMNAFLSAEEKSALLSEIPLSRMGSAEEVAALIYFLSEQRYVTGQVIAINGGFHI